MIKEGTLVEAGSRVDPIEEANQDAKAEIAVRKHEHKADVTLLQ